MARRRMRSNSTSSGNRRNAGRDAAYVYDNTARSMNVQRQINEPSRKVLSNETRKNREKARHMSPGYVLFLAAAMCIAGMVLINYIQLQSEITNKTRHISSMQSQLNNLRSSNDETYNRIISNVDLEEIKRIAIGELGMTYAGEGQIKTYTNKGNDYFRAMTNDSE